MNFKEWLPVTARNRVALGLGFAALVMFLVWNSLPYYEYSGASEPDGIVLTSFWPDVVSPDLYLMVLKAPDVEGFLSIAAFMALIFNALITLTMVPFWKLLHAVPYVRVPLAVLSLVGGSVITWHLVFPSSDELAPYWIPILLLMAMGMFALSTALFLFKNELALRELRDRPQTD